jgi:hypothetical protein
MAQHDYVIANDTAANVRADINNALAAVVSNNSGATQPTTMYANEWWYDTATDTLKIRAEANDAWISVALLNQTTDQSFPIVGGVTVTSTGTELNLVDGSVAGTIVNSKAVVYGAAGQVNATTLQIAGTSITSTAAELNKLAGSTATAAELNFVAGVTSAIQTQLNAKAALASPTFTGTPAAPTAAAGTSTTQVATTAFAVTAAQGTFLASQATTSGTAFDFTGIPSTAKEIEIHYEATSLNASENHLVQLIVSGTPLTTGYASSSGTSGAENSATTGFIVFGSNTVQNVSGSMRIVQVEAGTWIESHSVSLGSADANGGGFRSGVGTVTGVRITRAGTASFDNGAVTVSYR